MSNPSVKKKGVFLRLIKLLFKSYPVLVPVAMFCIMFAAAVSAIPAVFMQQVFLAMEKWAVSGDWAQASAEIIPAKSGLPNHVGMELVVEDPKLRQSFFDSLRSNEHIAVALPRYS